MAVTNRYPFLLGDMFAQPVDRPSFEWIAVVSGAVLKQFVQEFEIFRCDYFWSSDWTFQVLVCQPRLGELDPPTRRAWSATQLPTHCCLGLPLICQQDDFQSLSIGVGRLLRDLLLQQLTLKWR